MKFTKKELLDAFQPIKLKDFFIGNQYLPYIMFDHQELFVSNTQEPETLLYSKQSMNNKMDDNIYNTQQEQSVLEKYYPIDRSEIFYKFNNNNNKAKSRNSLNSQKGLSNLKNISSTNSRNGSFMQTDSILGNAPFFQKRNSNNNVQIKRQSKNYVQDIISEQRRGSKNVDSPAWQGSPQKQRTIIAPFSQSPMMKSVQLDERGWYYVDEQDYIQGPFTSFEMDNWYFKGYFVPTLLVGYKNTNKRLFFQLEKLYKTPVQCTYLNQEVKQFLKTEQNNIKNRSQSLCITKNRKNKVYEACTSINL